jgi:hypothetical protein
MTMEELSERMVQLQEELGISYPQKALEALSSI